MSDKKFVHFLLTRFNVPIETELTKQLESIRVATDERYLDERFRLFLTYTVPSVKAQTNQKFIWIVMFSNATPGRFKNIINQLSREMNYFKPIYVGTAEEVQLLLTDYMRTFDAEWKITSRLDNDDALSSCYIEFAQDIFMKNTSEKYSLIFNNGIQYDEVQKIASEYKFPLNHFSTLVTKKLDNILNYGHMNIKEHMSVLAIDNRIPLWLEVVHGSNVSNRMHTRMHKIVRDENIFKSFGGTYQYRKITIFIRFKYSVLVAPYNFLRLLKQYGMKGLGKKIKFKMQRKIGKGDIV